MVYAHLSWVGEFSSCYMFAYNNSIDKMDFFLKDSFILDNAKWWRLGSWDSGKCKHVLVLSLLLGTFVLRQTSSYHITIKARRELRGGFNKVQFKSSLQINRMSFTTNEWWIWLLKKALFLKKLIQKTKVSVQLNKSNNSLTIVCPLILM